MFRLPNRVWIPHNQSKLKRSIANFGAFGIGMATPLLVFALISESWRNRVLGLLTDHRRTVNAVTGFALFVISGYYLLFVFKIANIG